MLARDPFQLYYPRAECEKIGCNVPRQLEPDSRAALPNVYREKVEEICKSRNCHPRNLNPL